jgi:hypothetical protein
MIANTVRYSGMPITVQAGIESALAVVVMLAASVSGPTTPLNGYDVRCDRMSLCN